MKQIIVPALLISLCFFKGNAKDNTHKNNYLGTNFYYNKHFTNFKHGAMLDVSYERTFNRWVGLQTSLGFNKASMNLNNWKEDFLDNKFSVPSLTSSILLNLVGNFYCVQTLKHRLKLGFGIEYRNINDVITSGFIDLQPDRRDPIAIITQSWFEKYNDFGISANISYQYIFKKGIGINTAFGYNHYFTELSKNAYDRNTNTKYRNGGSNFLKLGIGILYNF